jgi:hypothetical protein
MKGLPEEGAFALNWAVDKALATLRIAGNINPSQ